jgi:hypothetical protein
MSPCTGGHRARALVEEVARLTVICRNDAVRMPRRGGERWLWILRQLELLARPLQFTCSPRWVQLYDGGTTAYVRSGGGNGRYQV